jgi:DNA-binding transcriptional MerR regulator
VPFPELSVSGRTYLSIGDVLTLLRQEFPDVTISKIRFLESQGLVNPERTPSGYRKFYEQDVERLRWVLRQQREHFLPLKVIKGRLDEGAETDDLDDFDGESGDGSESVLAEVDVVEIVEVMEVLESSEAPDRRRRPEPVLVGQAATSATGRSRPGSSLPGFETAAPAPAHVDAAEMAAATFAETGDEGPEKVPPPVAAAARRTTTSRQTGGRGASKAGAPTAAKAAGAAPAPGPSATEPPLSTMSGNSMTIEELASATGLTVGDVQQLESFGLVTSRPVGGVSYYDDDALAIARLAAGFAQFGVEARHLRLHKHAAEREAGFIEQIVLPLLKQRNPEARQRAHDNVTELTRLGQALRAVLLRNALRDQLGG